MPVSPFPQQIQVGAVNQPIMLPLVSGLDGFSPYPVPPSATATVTASIAIVTGVIVRDQIAATISNYALPAGTAMPNGQLLPAATIYPVATFLTTATMFPVPGLWLATVRVVHSDLTTTDLSRGFSIAVGLVA